MIKLGGGWDEFLKSDFESDNYKKLRSFLKTEYSQHIIYPNMYDIFNAFKLTPLDKVKVVILGQDPYHGEGQAHGLSFSVKPGIALPPSLINIYKEIKSDTGIECPHNYGCLISWAKQGVLLMNTVLTVRQNSPNSHKNCGWEIFTDSVIKKLSSLDRPLVFILWGANARNKKSLIDSGKHLILESAHPSPLSASGFFGCRHFSKTNNFLVNNGLEPIDWAVNQEEL